MAEFVHFENPKEKDAFAVAFVELASLLSKKASLEMILKKAKRLANIDCNWIFVNQKMPEHKSQVEVVLSDGSLLSSAFFVKGGIFVWERTGLVLNDVIAWRYSEK